LLLLFLQQFDFPELFDAKTLITRDLMASKGDNAEC